MKCLSSLFGSSSEEQPKDADENVQLIDPNTILYTDDLAPLDPVTSPPRDDEPPMHEDDWCQVEFFNKGYLPERLILLLATKRGWS